jgi:hypothetical protein
LLWKVILKYYTQMNIEVKEQKEKPIEVTISLSKFSKKGFILEISRQPIKLKSLLELKNLVEEISQYNLEQQNLFKLGNSDNYFQKKLIR